MSGRRFLRTASCELGDLGARDNVLAAGSVVDVEVGRRLTILYVARDGDSALRDKVSAALEEDLCAPSVKLRIIVICGVESKDLGAGKVVTSLKALGEVHIQ